MPYMFVVVILIILLPIYGVANWDTLAPVFFSWDNPFFKYPLLATVGFVVFLLVSYWLDD